MRYRQWIKVKLFSSVFYLLCINSLSAQPANVNKQQIQSDIYLAIAKAYQASVLVWEIDAETENRLSAQFSGVVISADGEIFSAAHVVHPGKTYKVMFANGRECNAKGLGRISIPPDFMQPDAAMLKIIQKGNWPFVEMGWSSSLKINQPCLSIAYPESLAQRKPTIRFGYISSLKNEFGFLQSTCIMEPGDSGGPLFDVHGRLIGIHSGIRIPEEVNYEIPIDTYRRYRTALTIQKDYTVLPSDTDQILPDIQLQRQATNYAPIRFRNILRKFEPACVRISSSINGAAQEILGTVIAINNAEKKNISSFKSLVVSKSSVIGEQPMILLANHKVIALKVLLRDKANDLVLLFPMVNLKTPIQIHDRQQNQVATNQPGKLLLSITGAGNIKQGILGSEALDFPKVSSYGRIGAYIDTANGQLEVLSVQPGGAADIGGLKKGDRLQTFDQQVVHNKRDYVKEFEKTMAGDTIIIGIYRNGQVSTKKVILLYPAIQPSNHPVEQFKGGKSLRRDGFTGVYIQDAVISASECGSPVFDLSGNLVGVNIARFSRANTIIMPVNRIFDLLNSYSLQVP